MPASTFRTVLTCTVLLASSVVAVPAAADTVSDAASPASIGTLQTLTVTPDDLASGESSITVDVPRCVYEVAFVMSGGDGGSAGAAGTPGYAPGGSGAVVSGTLWNLSGETLTLYPATAGGSVAAPDDPETPGMGGTGHRAGGRGHGRTGETPGVTFDGGGGGGGASGIRRASGTLDVAVAGGGGGAGGPAMDAESNTGIGGTNGGAGGDGVNFVGSGGAGGELESGLGANGTGISTVSGGAGGGGGGGGHRGGAVGRMTGFTDRGAGGGGAGSSFIDATLDSGGSIEYYGLSESDAGDDADGAITLAWYSCVSELTLAGTTTDADGTVAPASGWAQTITSDQSVSPDTGVLGADGTLVAVVDGYATETTTVTVRQEERDGWLLQNWSSTATDTPLAVCALNGSDSRFLSVTNLSASSYSVDIPSGSQVRCSSNTVEAAPEMTVAAEAQDLTTGGSDPVSVNAGDEVEFVYTITNRGTVPLRVDASESRIPDLRCLTEVVLPGQVTTCTGTTVVTRD